MILILLLQTEIASEMRPHAGTTVIAHDIFYNMPVRRRLISDTLTMEHVRRRLESTYLAHHNVAISLTNEQTGLIMC